MRKLGEQLQVERNKRIQDLKKLDEKDKKNGEKMRLEREKVAELAGKMMAEHKKLNKMQEDAWKLVNEGGIQWLHRLLLGRMRRSRSRMRRMIRRMDESISWKNAKWHVRRVDQNAISQEMAWEKSGSEDQFHHGPKDIEKEKK